jgi:hypothetical protein
MACIEHGAADDRRLLGRIGLCFAVISAASIVTVYFIQLAVVEPSLLNRPGRRLPSGCRNVQGMESIGEPHSDARQQTIHALPAR